MDPHNTNNIGITSIDRVNEDMYSYDGVHLHHLERGIYASANKFQGRTYIHIRHYLPTIGHKLAPTKKGVMLTPESFDKLISNSIPIMIEAAALDCQPSEISLDQSGESNNPLKRDIETTANQRPTKKGRTNKKLGNKTAPTPSIDFVDEPKNIDLMNQ